MTFQGNDHAANAGQISFTQVGYPLADIVSQQGYLFQETNNTVFATALNPSGDYFKYY